MRLKSKTHQCCYILALYPHWPGVLVAQRRSISKTTGLPFYFEFSVLASYCGQAQMEEFGASSADTLCDCSRYSHVTVLRKKTNLYVSCMCLWASSTRSYFNMDNKLQALPTLLSLLAAVVQLNSAFYHHTTTAYMCRKDITRQTVTVPLCGCVISPTLTGKT